MGKAVLIAASSLVAAAFGIAVKPTTVHAYEVEKYTVYCANSRIEVSFWDLEQMKVRNGSDVCQFQSYTSYSSALNFAKKNFGGEDQPCSC